MSDPEVVDPYDSGGRPKRSTMFRGLARGVALLVGAVIAFYGVALYALRCFSTCPTDPAENTISQILTLSLVALGVVVVVAAASIATKLVAPATWVIAAMGILMTAGGVVALTLAPSLRFPGDRTSAVVFALVDVAVGAGIVALGSWVRRRTEQAR